MLTLGLILLCTQGVAHALLLSPFILIHAILERNNLLCCELGQKLAQIAQFVQMLDFGSGYELVQSISNILEKSVDLWVCWELQFLMFFGN